MRCGQVGARFNRVKDVMVVGGGTAGFMAALALKTKLPRLDVTVVRSREIGIIGVGEGSTPPFARFIHGTLGISHSEFVRATLPGLKTGTCFLWGPREKFFFPFGTHMELKLQGMSRTIGYYCDHGDPACSSPNSALMAANRPLVFNPQGQLVIGDDHAYHIENDRFAAFLESTARTRGVRILDGTIENVRQDENGIAAVILTDGQSLSADLFVDCSGFRALLLGQTLGEPRMEYGRSLFCDRALVGGWDRPAGTPMLSYTVSETMDSGWCWRIEHPDRIHRGYVYSSAFISDDEAERELRTKNPQIGPTRIVKFKSGRFNRSWVKNVVALGNASGFTEPLEATTLAFISSRCELLVEILTDADLVISEPGRLLFNRHTVEGWDALRDFLTLHYKVNTRVDTPFWKACRADVDLGTAQPVLDYYTAAGPSPTLASGFLYPGRGFGITAYLAILVGQKAPWNNTFQPTPAELNLWSGWCRHNAQNAAAGATAEQALAIISGGVQV